MARHPHDQPDPLDPLGPMATVEALIGDVEQQAAGLHFAERRAEADELGRAHYAEVTLADRLFAGLGHLIEVAVLGGDPLRGELRATGAGWLRLRAAPAPEAQWVVRLDAVTGLVGLPERAVLAPARPVASRLSVRSALRGVDPSVPAVCRLIDGTTRRGWIGRVGADFIHLVEPRPATGPGGAARTCVVPLGTLAAVGTTPSDASGARR